MGTEEITLGVMACIVPALWRQGQEDPYLSSSSRSLRVCFLKIHNKGEWFMRNVHCPWPSYMPADMHYTDMHYTDTHCTDTHAHISTPTHTRTKERKEGRWKTRINWGKCLLLVTHIILPSVSFLSSRFIHYTQYLSETLMFACRLKLVCKLRSCIPMVVMIRHCTNSVLPRKLRIHGKQEYLAKFFAHNVI